jgi:hypothetical protein
MSQQAPTKPYVYQPDPAPPPGIDPANCRIWSVGGPGTESYTGVGQRYTRAEADAIVRQLELSARLTELVGESGGTRCDKCGGQMAHYRLYGYRCMRCP